MSADVSVTEWLRGEFPAGSTVTTVLRHVSGSGMSRSISVVKGRADGTVRCYDREVASVLGLKLDSKNGGLKVVGCGMDMGYYIVYSMSHVLFRDGFECLGPDCPSNDHVNERVADYRVGRVHAAGGYALLHRWLG